MQKANKAAVEAAKEIETRLREAKQAVLAEAREKREDKKRRRAENELKASSYQVISDPTKLKKMSKGSLRQVKKMRMNDQGVVELVGAYSK